MKLLIYVLLNIIFMLATIASAAPVGNIGAPLVWGEGFLVRGGLFNMTVSIDFDLQKNEFPAQLNRIVWDDPGQSNSEDRHYEQFRSSKNKYSTSGVTLGATFKQSNMVYLMAGVVNSSVDLIYEDKTIYYGFETKADFESENDFYYGLGWSGIMHEGVFLEETPIRFGMDAKYRKLEMEDNDLSGSGKFYSASLDEFQFAFVLSAEVNNLFPYFGFRISSITGREKFIDTTNKSLSGNDYIADYYENGYIEYRRDISWFKNTGYLAGVSYYIKELVIVNLEYRSGSEEGFGFSTTVKF